MTHSLTLGSLLLTDSMPDVEHGFVFSVLADNMGFGVAQGVQEVVTSLLADGDLTRTRRYGNREVTFAVEITGPSLAALAQGEAALRREVGRGNTLTWQAPDLFAVPTVFEVLDSEMSQTFDDLDELRRRRTFKVTLTCAPFARSAVMVTVDALPTGTADVTIDTCDSLDGWTATRAGWPATVVGSIPGAVGVAERDSAATAPETWTLTRTGSVDFTATPYLAAEVSTISHQAGLRVAAIANGVSLPVLQSRLIAGGDGFHEVVFDATGVGVASSITFKHTSLEGEPWQGIYVRHVSRTDIAPSVTPRQQTRLIDPGGTERTPASIEVSAPDGTSDLFLTIVHTCPEDGSGYSPPLQRWSVTGNPDTLDSSAFSGAWETLNSPFTADVPISAVPADGYVLAARVRSSITQAVKLTWAVTTVVPNYPDPMPSDDGEWIVVLNAGKPAYVPLGVTTLPTLRATASNATVRVIIAHSPADGTIELDEGWLFRAGDDSALTVVEGIYRSRVWLDSATVNTPVPTVLIGDTPDRVDAIHPAGLLAAAGHHVLTPGGTAVFTATQGVPEPRTAATFYRRWHSNAAE